MERTRIVVTRSVWDGLEVVRRSGLTNMLDAPRVAEIADHLGYDEAAAWIQDNRRSYAEGVFMGFKVQDEGEPKLREDDH